MPDTGYLPQNYVQQPSSYMQQALSADQSIYRTQPQNTAQVQPSPQPLPYSYSQYNPTHYSEPSSQSLPQSQVCSKSAFDPFLPATQIPPQTLNQTYTPAPTPTLTQPMLNSAYYPQLIAQSQYLSNDLAPKPGQTYGDYVMSLSTAGVTQDRIFYLANLHSATLRSNAAHLAAKTEPPKPAPAPAKTEPAKPAKPAPAPAPTKVEPAKPAPAPAKQTAKPAPTKVVPAKPTPSPASPAKTTPAPAAARPATSTPAKAPAHTTPVSSLVLHILFMYQPF